MRQPVIKKLAAWALTFMLLFSMVPASALAVESNDIGAADLNVPLLPMTTEDLELEQAAGPNMVFIDAPAGTVPVGTEVKVTPVDTSAARAAIAASIPSDMYIKELYAYDIKLMVGDQEIQPKGEVRVSIINGSGVSLLAANDEASTQTSMIFHITDGGAVEMNGLAESGFATFTTDHFSVYAVAVLGRTKTIEQPYEAKNTNGFVFEGDDGEISFDSLAFDFHIFSMEATLGQHTNGNIATNVLHGNDQGFGNNQNRTDVIGEENYIGQSADKVGNIAISENGKIVLGYNVDVSVVDNGNKVEIGGGNSQQADGSQYDVIYKEELREGEEYTPYIDIQAELNKLKELSSELAKQKDNENVVKMGDETQGQWTYDVSGCADDVCCVEIKPDTLIGTSSGQAHLTIAGASQKTVVINVNMTGQDANVMKKFWSSIDGHNNGEDVVYNDCNLLWNFFQEDENGNPIPWSPTEQAEIATEIDSFAGTILAPSASIKYGAVNGSIIAETTEQGGRESHKWDFTGTSAKIQVNKILTDADGATGKKTFYFALFDENDVRVSNVRVQSLELEPDNNGHAEGTVSFSNLKPGTYKVYETDANGNRNSPPDGYTIGGNGASVTLTGTNTTGSVTITNSKGETTNTKVTIRGRKMWIVPKDEELPDITLYLYQSVNGGQETEVSRLVVKTPKNTIIQYFEFPDQPKFDEQGNLYTYRVEEMPVPGYVTSQSGNNILNRKQETVSVHGTKSWSPANVEHPEKVTVWLKENGTKTDKSCEANAENEWTYSFEDLPKYDAKGNIIQYDVVEETVEGFEASYQENGNEINIINTAKTSQKIQVTGKKTWIAPGETWPTITLTLYRKIEDGEEEVVKTKNIDRPISGNVQQYVFDDLDATDEDGHPYIYRVAETVPDGYISTQVGNDITNIKTTSISGTKSWNVPAGTTLPDSVKVYLTKNSAVVADRFVTTTAALNWQYSFSDLPMYEENGTPITYGVQEDPITGYQATYNDSNYDITNTITGTVSISGTKTWKAPADEIPESVTVTLYANEQPTDNTQTITASDRWQYSFSNLDKYDDQGQLIAYRVSETIDGKTPEEAGFTVNYAQTENGYDITNTITGTVSISGTKTWKAPADEIPESVTVTLYANEQPTDNTQTITASGNWQYSFSNLDKYDDQGQLIAYRVSETIDGKTPEEAGFTVNYALTTYGYDITNTIKQQYTEISGTKNWIAPESEIPASLTVTLKQNNAVYKTATITKENGWKYSFTELPMYDEEGQLYRYEVEEETLTGFTSSQSGTNFTNTINQKFVTISGQKTWTVPEGVTLPESITVNLLADGKQVATQTVKDPWTYSFEGQPKYTEDRTRVIVYTVQEEKVSGYKTTYGDNYSIVNEYIPTPSPSASPKPTDEPTPSASPKPTDEPTPSASPKPTDEPTPSASPKPTDEPTPSASPKPTDEPTPSASPKPTDKPTPSASPKPTDEPTPSASPKPTDKPSPSVTPTVTPTATPTEEVTPAVTPIPTEEPTPTVPVQRYMSIRGQKVWSDFDDYDGIRPESVEVTLQRRSAGRGYETVQTITVTGEGNEWSFIFEHMPEFDERFERYQYRVVETPVEGYTAQTNGYTITNIHAAQTPEPTPSPTPTPEPTPTPLPERFYNEMPTYAARIRYVDGEWIYIDDFGVPLGLVGQTGDDDNLFAVFAGMAVLLVMACTLAVIIVRKERKKHT